MTINRQSPLRRVAVLGSGVEALVATLVLRETLPGAEILLVGPPGRARAMADRFPAVLPTALPVLEQAGLDASRLIAAGLAAPSYGTRFVAWPGPDWILPVGPLGTAVSAASFHQDWLEARRAGDGTPIHRYAPAAAALEAGRPPPREVRPALALHPARMEAFLADLVGRRGIARRPAAAPRPAAAGRAPAIEADLPPADLVVDCRGDRQAENWVGWQTALPVVRVVPVPSLDGAVPGLEICRATPSGWSAGLGPSAWDLSVEVRLAGSAAAAADVVPIEPGRARAAWVDNRVTLGAVALPPVGWPSLTQLLLDLQSLVDLLPGRVPHPGLASEFNRRAAGRADRLRDWQSILFALGPRRGASWQATAGLAMPADAERVVEQYLRRGSLAVSEDAEDVVGRDDWLAMLAALGPMPRRRDPVAMSVDGGARDARLAALRAASTPWGRR